MNILDSLRRNAESYETSVSQVVKIEVEVTVYPDNGTVLKCKGCGELFSLNTPAEKLVTHRCPEEDDL